MPSTQRNVSWIELFYDLIFVAAAHQLALMLASSMSIIDALEPILLFVPVLWCWMSHTLFTNLFSDRSWFYQFSTLLTIFGTVILVILLPSAMTEHETYFAYAYVFVKAVLVMQYIVWSFLEFHRLPHMLPIIIGNTGSGVLWALSPFADNAQIWWALAMLIDLLTPIFTKTKDLSSNMNPHHLPERMGLLTVVVIGEMIISLVITSFEHDLSKEITLVLAIGIFIAFLIFWTYFRFIEQAIIGFSKGTSRMYFYSHLPMVLGLICIAAGYRSAINGSDANYLLMWGIILFTLSLRLMRYVVDQRFLKRQIVLVALLFPIVLWYSFYAGSALINLAVLSASLALYIIISEFILGWKNYSQSNAPEQRMKWGNEQ